MHDRHGPGPDISKYDRQLPNIPETSASYDVIFEPEEFLAKASSSARFWAPDQREELQIRYQECACRVDRSARTCSATGRISLRNHDRTHPKGGALSDYPGLRRRFS